MSSDLAPETGVAGRYATALFELALEEDALESAEADVKALAGLIAVSDDLKSFLKSPIYGREHQIKAVAAIADKAGLGPLTANFLKLVAENRRLFALEGMLRAFARRAALHRGEVSAEALTAAPMTDDQAKALRLEIERQIGKAVNLETRVDPDLLGGLVVKVGSMMIDSSLRTKINRLKTVMKEA